MWILLGFHCQPNAGFYWSLAIWSCKILSPVAPTVDHQWTMWSSHVNCTLQKKIQVPTKLTSIPCLSYTPLLLHPKKYNVTFLLLAQNWAETQVEIYMQALTEWCVAKKTPKNKKIQKKLHVSCYLKIHWQVCTSPGWNNKHQQAGHGCRKMYSMEADVGRTIRTQNYHAAGQETINNHILIACGLFLSGLLFTKTVLGHLVL